VVAEPILQFLQALVFLIDKTKAGRSAICLSYGAFRSGRAMSQGRPAVISSGKRIDLLGGAARNAREFGSSQTLPRRGRSLSNPNVPFRRVGKRLPSRWLAVLETRRARLPKPLRQGRMLNRGEEFTFCPNHKNVVSSAYYSRSQHLIMFSSKRTQTHLVKRPNTKNESSLAGLSSPAKWHDNAPPWSTPRGHRRNRLLLVNDHKAGSPR